MPISTRRCLVLTFAACFGLITSGASARAGVMHEGWNYAIDSQTDGSGAGDGFELRGMAYQQVGNVAYFAISSRAPLGGIARGGTLNNAISYGDLILNFSLHNLDTAAEFTDPNVFAIRFDASNDSLGNVGGSNATLGLFGNISIASYTLQNSGYGSLQQYHNSGFGVASGAMGDLNTTADVVSYFGNGMMLPNISSGTRLGDVSLLNETQLDSLGLDFAHFGADPNGNHIFGFSIDSMLLPAGNFIASLFFECANDGTALFGTVTETPVIQAAVPEPGSIALFGIGIVGLAGWKLRRRKN
jgi:hypothetical protein